MKNQGQNGVQKQARRKKVRESALTGQKQALPTDSQSIGGLTNGLSGLVKMSVDHQVPNTKGGGLRKIDTNDRARSVW